MHLWCIVSWVKCVFGVASLVLCIVSYIAPQGDITYHIASVGWGKSFWYFCCLQGLMGGIASSPEHEYEKLNYELMPGPRLNSLGRYFTGRLLEGDS